MNVVNRSAVLPRTFYQCDTKDVARNLLGKLLCRQTPEGFCSGTIVETEAYLRDDPASHTFRGMTPRNVTMFGLAGHTYVYISYGIHNMLNIATSDEGIGEGVLIRAADPVEGVEIMRMRRQALDGPQHLLASGPGRLTEAFGISRSTDNGVDVITREGMLWIEDQDQRQELSIITSFRIGLTKAADKPLRYFVGGNKAVSRKTPALLTERRGDRG